MRLDRHPSGSVVKVSVGSKKIRVRNQNLKLVPPSFFPLFTFLLFLSCGLWSEDV